MDHYSLNSSEESGWTSYLEDFCNTREPTSCFSVGGSSFLSDAASSAACNFSSHPNHHHHHLPNPKKLTFNKTRTKQISRDDPLEDTATSPLNSPKDGELRLAEMVSRKIHHHHQLEASPSTGKGIKGAERCSELEIGEEAEEDEEDKREIKLKEKSNIDCTDLKKRGLCLVPLSTLVNYFGDLLLYLDNKVLSDHKLFDRGKTTRDVQLKAYTRLALCCSSRESCISM